MQPRIILFICIALLLSVISNAEEALPKTHGLEALDIETLIEKAKEASPSERTRIEDLIKKKIAQAHRKGVAKG